jgi:hypothetical protein
VSPNVSTLFPDTHTGAGEVIREREIPTLTSRQAQRGRAEPFLRGPIPVRLIGLALDLPGRPLPVFLAIWHRVALTGKPWVSLPANVMADFRFGPTVKARAIAELERAGLVRVKRTPGRPVMISLLSKRAGGMSAADAKFAPDPLHIDRLALVSETRVARDDEQPADTG